MSDKIILVCGGAGYIGSHMLKMLHGRGYTPVCFDNLSTGHSEAIKWGESIQGDLLREEDLDRAFEKFKVNAVMHFAARSIVPESVHNPELYWQNNVAGAINMLAAMRRHGVERLVFSSTAAVYGPPETQLLSEEHPTRPANPYGVTKLAMEQAISSFAAAYKLRAVCFRYFNAAGADPDAEVGESHNPETHLIPNVIKSLQKGGSPLTVFGDDYDTPDGSCVRDYIHINDICSAHLMALEYMEQTPGNTVFNLGSETGFSVLEIINAVERISGQSVPHTMAERRPGDVGRLVADSSKVREALGWKPEHSLDEILSTAIAWHAQQPY